MPSDPNTRLAHLAKNLAIGVLLLATGGLGFLVWLDRQEIQLLRAQIVADSANRQQSGGKKALRAADNSVADDSMDATAAEGKKSRGKKSENPDGTQRPKAKDRQGWRAYADMAGNPTFEALTKAQAGAQIGRTYGWLFKSLGLSPDAQAKLQDLLTQRQMALTDAVVASRENGLKSKTAPEEFSQATNAAAAPFDTQIRQLLGDPAFNQLEQYQESIPQRNLVGELQQRLATTDAPLSDDQATKLVQMLSAAKPIDVNNGSSAVLGTHSLLAGGGVAKVSDTTLVVAEQLLSAPQVQALQQIQIERQQQNELDKLMKGKPAQPAASAQTPGK